MTLGLDPLSKVSGSSIVDGKNMVGRGDPTKDGQLSSSVEISKLVNTSHQ